MQVNRRLYRCRHDRRIAGVAAGVAEFFELDPTLVRVVWFLSIFFGGLGIFLYIAMALIVPLEPLTADEASALAAVGPAAVEGHRHLTPGGGSGRFTTFLGIALLVVGAVALAEVVLPGVHAWRYLWPLLILGLGGLLVAGAVRRASDKSNGSNGA
jgi:phage shock protein PspC (stress-responsive transcriptional regulator)